MEANFCNTVSPFLIQAVKDQTVPPDYNGDEQRPQSQCVVGLEMSRNILQLYYKQFSNRKKRSYQYAANQCCGSESTQIRKFFLLLYGSKIIMCLIRIT
jgi:hypothetical protein